MVTKVPLLATVGQVHPPKYTSRVRAVRVRGRRDCRDGGDRMNVPKSILAGMAAVTLITGAAFAQKPSNANRLASDNKFLVNAAQGGMAEVEMGRLAEQHASSDQVKKFGQQMVTDHSKINDQLKKVASKEGETVPTEVNAKEKATIDKLSNLNGAEFDHAYMTDMVKDHKEDVSEFKKEADSGDNPELKAFASQNLPTFQEHLKLAQDVETQVKK
jgi:putative membrane protein